MSALKHVLGGLMMKVAGISEMQQRVADMFGMEPLDGGGFRDKPRPAPEPFKVAELHQRIVHVVEQLGDPTYEQIRLKVASPHVKIALSQLVNHGVLRMKEDDVEHDWTYRMGHTPLGKVGQEKTANTKELPVKRTKQAAPGDVGSMLSQIPPDVLRYLMLGMAHGGITGAVEGAANSEPGIINTPLGAAGGALRGVARGIPTGLGAAAGARMAQGAGPVAQFTAPVAGGAIGNQVGRMIVGSALEGRRPTRVKTATEALARGFLRAFLASELPRVSMEKGASFNPHFTTVSNVVELDGSNLEAVLNHAVGMQYTGDQLEGKFPLSRMLEVLANATGDPVALTLIKKAKKKE